MRFIQKSSFILCAIAMLSLGLLAGCGGGDTFVGGGGGNPEPGPGPEPTPTQSATLTDMNISVGGDPATASNPVKDGSNGRANVTLLDAQGNPMPNEVVTFSTTSGNLKPASGNIQTDSSGQASITITAGSDGQSAATLTAVYTPESGTSVTASTAYTTLGDAAPSKKPTDYTLTNMKILVGGSPVGTSHQITATTPGIATVILKAPNGQPVSGQLVVFSTTAGGLDPATGSALTDGSGKAQITLTAGNVKTAGLLTATYTQANGGVTSTSLGFQTKGNATSSKATPTLTNMQILVGGNPVSATNQIAAGSPGEVSVVLKDSQGNPMTGALVVFSTTAGAMNPSTGAVMTDGSGVASLKLLAGSDGQTAGTLTATYTSDNGIPVKASANFSTKGDATIGGNASYKLDIALSPTHINRSNPGTATVTLEDSSGNPMESKVITFTTTAGILDPTSGKVLTGPNGQASVTLRDSGVATAGTLHASYTDASGNSVTAQYGFNLEGNGSTGTNQSYFENLKITVGGVLATAGNPVKQGSNGQATVTLLDPQGNPIKNAVVTFSTTSGGLLPASGSVQTDSSGQANIKITAGSDGKSAATLTAVYTPETGASVTASTAFTTKGDAPPTGGTTDFTLTNMQILVNNTTPVSATHPVTATDPATASVILKDPNGDPLSNQVVVFSTTAGGLEPTTGSVLTDAAGKAQITLTAGNVETAGLLTATYTQANGAVTKASLGFQTAGDATSSSATPTLTNMQIKVGTNPVGTGNPISYASHGTATVVLRDSQGNLLTNALVVFSTTAGLMNPSSGAVLTDGSGIATLKLLAGSGGRTAGTLTATYTGSNGIPVKASANFSTMGDAPTGGNTSYQLSINIAPVNIDAANPGNATVTLKNSKGNPLANKVINFATTAGTLSPDSGLVLTDNTGTASIILRDTGVETAGTLTATFTDSKGNSVSTQTGFALAGDGNVAPSKPTLTVTLDHSDVSGGNPATATITATQADGTAMDSVVVQVTTSAGVLDPASGKVMTDGSGVAHIQLQDTGVKTAGILTASLVSDPSVSGQTAFTMDGTGTPNAQPSLSVKLAPSQISAGNPGTATITVLKADGVTPLTGAVVEVSTSAGTLMPATGMVLTDGSGVATVTLKDAGVQTAGTLTATLADNGAVSDTATFSLAGDGAVPTNKPDLSIQWTGPQGNQIDAAHDGTASITLKGVNGNPLANKVVTVTTTEGVMVPASGLVLTNGSGQANITLQDNGVKTAGILTATFTDSNGHTGTAQSGYTLAGDGSPTANQPKLSKPALTNSGSPIGTRGNPITQIAPATVTVTLLDADGTPIPGALISFSLSSDVGSLGQQSALTDSSGEASVILYVGNTQGAGTLTATYTDPNDSSISVGSHASFAVQVSSTTGLQLSTPDLEDASNHTVGTTSDPITDNRPATATVTLTNNGTPLANKVITFTLVGANGVGALDPTTGTALTDGSGTARITLKSGANEGAATLKASYSENGKTATSQIDYTTKGAGQVTTQTLKLGTLDTTTTPATFTNSLQAPSGASVGSTYSIQVDVVDVTNAANPVLYTDAPVEVSFTSACAQAGKASLSPATAISIGGHALTTYKPENNNCISDNIQASAIVNGDNLTASTGSFPIEAAPPNAITFQGASPAPIGVKGSSGAGVSETSTMTFQVMDSQGHPVGQGTHVAFTVKKPVGGFGIKDQSGTVMTTTASTDADGKVSVTVVSGFVPTVGTVEARLQDDPNTPLDESTIYAVGTVSVQEGVAAEDNFVVSVETLNPAAGNHVGVTDKVTARAADRYNVHVPDGTIIHFASKLGDIDGSCTIQDGSCSVTWYSHADQDATVNFDKGRSGRPCFGGDWKRHGLPPTPEYLQCGDHDLYGVNVITAWTKGEESFDDSNNGQGNNRFDDGEHFVDLPDYFQDYNLTGLYEPPDANYSGEDFSPNHPVYNGPNGKYDGLSCTQASTQCTHQLIDVRGAATMVLSTDGIQMGLWDVTGQIPPTKTEVAATTLIKLDKPTNGWGTINLIPLKPTTAVPAEKIEVIVTDLNGNAPPKGTTVRAQTKSVGASILGPATCPVTNTVNPMVCTFTLDGYAISGAKFTFTANSGGGGITVSKVLEAP